ncbi:hypothetical protein Ljor_2222 [Legionella jordanis]|uniref:Uncharacterized protein n=1 Tax=Legionella jordanis TaxID=456 RepID=A0A0W0VCQ1_9GAMM|nr:hypothetical protein Ljor_2222 [Legionella jordanis]VEH13993.1 Uncharacterised protein [Legionella jordanis]
MKAKMLLLSLCCYLHYKYLRATRRQDNDTIRINLQEMTLNAEIPASQTLH